MTAPHLPPSGAVRAVDRIEGREERRSWDQHRAIQAGLARSGARWDWTAAVSWHTGWPRTSLEPVVAAGSAGYSSGPRNAARFADFAAVDMRLRWRKPLTRGELLVSGEISNLTDRNNECCIRYSITPGADGSPELNERMRHWLPLVPSVGLLWKV